MRIKNEKRLENVADTYTLFTKTKIHIIAAKISSPLPRTKPHSGYKYLRHPVLICSPVSTDFNKKERKLGKRRRELSLQLLE
jgi:hypothetical protein